MSGFFQEELIKNENADRPWMKSETDQAGFTFPRIKIFWSKVDIGRVDECWNWKKPGAYYEAFWTGSENEGVHRLSLQIKLGRRLKKTEWALHKCDNPACVNPNHLFVGNAKVNTRDMVLKGRNRNGQTILNRKKVREIRKKYWGGFTHAQLSYEYGVHPDTIMQIVKGLTWKDAGGPVIDPSFDMRRLRCGSKPFPTREILCPVCKQPFIQKIWDTTKHCSKKCAAFTGWKKRRDK